MSESAPQPSESSAWSDVWRYYGKAKNIPVFMAVGGLIIAGIGYLLIRHAYDAVNPFSSAFGIDDTAWDHGLLGGWIITGAGVLLLVAGLIGISIRGALSR